MFIHAMVSNERYRKICHSDSNCPIMGQANFQTITFYHPVLSQLFDHEILRSFPERGRKRERIKTAKPR